MNKAIRLILGGIVILGLVGTGIVLASNGSYDSEMSPTLTVTPIATDEPTGGESIQESETEQATEMPNPTSTTTATNEPSDTATPTASATATFTYIAPTDTPVQPTDTPTPEIPVLTVGLGCGYRDFADADGNGWYSPEGGDHWIGEAYGTEGCSTDNDRSGGSTNDGSDDPKPPEGEH